jgi:DNA-binding transcriptional ArsR family regulator
VTGDTFGQKAELLAAMANAQRLRMLTTLYDREMAVGNLAEHLGLSQSALSQHLSKLRAMDLVKTRRDAQTVYYSLKSRKVEAVLETLTQIFDVQGAEVQQKTRAG